MLNNNCNPVWCAWPCCSLKLQPHTWRRTPSCSKPWIDTFMNTWYTCVCSINHWQFCYGIRCKSCTFLFVPMLYSMSILYCAKLSWCTMWWGGMYVIVVYVICTSYVVMLDASIYVLEQQHSLIKNRIMQQLECAINFTSPTPSK